MKKWAILLALSAFPALGASVFGEWNHRSKVDGFTDKKTHIAEIFMYVGRQFSAITVRCQNGNFEVYINVNEYLGSDPAPVRYRFDDGPVIDSVWSISTQGTALFATHPVAFSKLLMASNSLLFRAIDFNGGEHDREFPMTNSAASIKPVMEACGV